MRGLGGIRGYWYMIRRVGITGASFKGRVMCADEPGLGFKL